MCENLTLPDGTYCESVGQLRKAIYPKKLTFYPGVIVGDVLEEECLCGVDFDALAKREGWTLAFDCGDSIASLPDRPA